MTLETSRSQITIPSHLASLAFRANTTEQSLVSPMLFKDSFRILCDRRSPQSTAAIYSLYACHVFICCNETESDHANSSCFSCVVQDRWHRFSHHAVTRFSGVVACTSTVLCLSSAILKQVWICLYRDAGFLRRATTSTIISGHAPHIPVATISTLAPAPAPPFPF